MKLEVRPFRSAIEYERMVAYFLDGDEAFLRGMGVDPARLPERQAWVRAALEDHERSDDKKERFYLAWLHGEEQVGHSSISHIQLPEVAHVHMHLWRQDLRHRGLGTEFIGWSIDGYFERFSLRRLACEPFADNPAPNQVVRKLGFRFVKRYPTVPSPSAWEQDVSRYEIARDEWEMLRRRRGSLSLPSMEKPVAAIKGAESRAGQNGNQGGRE